MAKQHVYGAMSVNHLGFGSVLDWKIQTGRSNLFESMNIFWGEERVGRKGERGGRRGREIGRERERKRERGEGQTDRQIHRHTEMQQKL